MLTTQESTELLQQIEQQTQKLINQVELAFNTCIPTIDTRLDLKGRAAGQALFHRSSCAIRYNPILIQQDITHFFHQTLPHEVAHIACRTLYGNTIKPHGKEWKNMMGFFNAPADRCHQLDTQTSTTKHYKTIDYQCDCQTHQLTRIRHNRILKGQSYLCRQCKKPLIQIKN